MVATRYLAPSHLLVVVGALVMALLEEMAAPVAEDQPYQHN
jgi:hypothetical protein